MREELEYKLKMLPDSPGCYLMKSEGQIIYVGKAVNLKNRVRQYFHSFERHTPKVRAMVSRVDDFDIVLCNTNFEALTLECNLIKRHRPFYNILLKDDKHYPYIRLDPSQPFARLELARRIDPRDGARYFGPYIGATAVRQILNEVGRLFPLRTCALKLPLSSPRRPCVNYQIGKCPAPCAGRISQADYDQLLQRATRFLSGDGQELTRDLEARMNEAAAAMRYEQAASYRDKIRDVKQMLEKQHAIQTRDVEQDILAVARAGADAMVALLHVREGRIEGSRNFLLEGDGPEEEGTLLASFVTQYYEDEHLIPREVLLAAAPEDTDSLESWLREKRGGAVTLKAPQRGEKAALIGIGRKNAEDALKKHQDNEKVKRQRTVGAMEELKQALSLPALPRRIEGYDISNTQGALSVAAMVVFEGGEAAKDQYRHFRIKTVEGANDFASMAEVIGRRFAHGLQEKKEREEAGLPVAEGRFSRLPDLVLIDGGPEQLAFAHRAMQDAGASVPMFGLAKRFEEIYLPGREQPIVLDRHSPALFLVQQVRDEAHRFGITHHRKLRGKEAVRSELSAVPGLGPKRQVELLKHFRSLSEVLSATEDELAAVPHMNRAAAKAVRAYAEQRNKKD